MALPAEKLSVTRPMQRLVCLNNPDSHPAAWAFPLLPGTSNKQVYWFISAECTGGVTNTGVLWRSSRGCNLPSRARFLLKPVAGNLFYASHSLFACSLAISGSLAWGSLTPISACISHSVVPVSVYVQISLFCEDTSHVGSRSPSTLVIIPAAALFPNKVTVLDTWG